ncbi:MAG TPA: DNA polymerase ligase N-terminal domain-containing protein, partial [Puia sp.]|nr:DNA polymerase ligase N-terminal domain-containing protein [Puia sp.]
MGLRKYKSKRNFSESPEPRGGKSSENKLRFVIQKHDASHLHYDFRLEMAGVLKSWAIPKGPSTDPAIKRLAMMVEDHPYDYRNFEGIIPSGYGAGTVMVWDEGFYQAADLQSPDKKSQDKELRHQLHAGKLKIVLHGHKLKGEFALVKAPGRGDNAWLFFKLKDSFSTQADITKKDKSVISNKTLVQIEKTTDNFYGAKRVKRAAVKSKKEIELNKRADVKKASLQHHASTPSKNNKKGHGKDKLAEISEAIHHAPKTKLPRALKPMLATLVDEPFDEPGWCFEVKWDGYRALGFIQHSKAEIKSRNKKSFDEKFYPITQSLANWDLAAVVDGEIVVLKDNGISDFGALQNWRSETDGALYYYLFDILWLNGKDLTGLPLSTRRKILEA